MFEIASHPTAFDLNSYAYAPRRPSAPSLGPTVQLPRTLARPCFVEVSREAIIAAAPELANVPAEYIRKSLRSKANEYAISFLFYLIKSNQMSLECSQGSLLLRHRTCRAQCLGRTCLILSTSP